jgi:methanogenic corrinoid protein MtbC1
VSGRSRRVGDRRLAAIGERYLAALCAADVPTAEAVVAEALVAGVAPTTIQVRVIGAAMERIGKLWERGEVTVADEHVATVLSYRALLPLQESLQIAPPRSRERVVLAAVEGQAHVLGLRMVADVLEGAGFEVLYLGADVPSGALGAFVAEHAPSVTGLTSTQTRDAPRLAAAIVAIHDAHPACRIMLGGNLTYYERRHGKTVAYRPKSVVLPKTCPRGGFRFSATFSFLDGTTAVAKRTIACPRRR